MCIGQLIEKGHPALVGKNEMNWYSLNGELKKSILKSTAKINP